MLEPISKVLAASGLVAYFASIAGFRNGGSVRVSVQDAVEELIDELPRMGRVSFRRLTEEFVERLEIVVRFLAVLELFKQGFVELDQPAQVAEVEQRPALRGQPGGGLGGIVAGILADETGHGLLPQGGIGNGPGPLAGGIDAEAELFLGDQGDHGTAFLFLHGGQEAHRLVGIVSCQAPDQAGFEYPEFLHGLWFPFLQTIGTGFLLLQPGERPAGVAGGPSPHHAEAGFEVVTGPPGFDHGQGAWSVEGAPRVGQQWQITEGFRSVNPPGHGFPGRRRIVRSQFPEQGGKGFHGQQGIPFQQHRRDRVGDRARVLEQVLAQHADVGGVGVALGVDFIHHAVIVIAQAQRLAGDARALRVGERRHGGVQGSHPEAQGFQIDQRRDAGGEGAQDSRLAVACAPARGGTAGGDAAGA